MLLRGLSVRGRARRGGREARRHPRLADPDTLKRANGAEEGDHRAAGPPSTRELTFPAIENQLVPGMRPDIYRRIAPMITVYSPDGRERVAGHARGPACDPRRHAADRRRVHPAPADALAAGQPPPVLLGSYAGGRASVTIVRAEARLDDGTYFARGCGAGARRRAKPSLRRMARVHCAPESAAPPNP